MNLYNEMKNLVRETYSNTSKQFDGYFKRSSIEGYVEMKEKLIYKQKVLQHKKLLAENNQRKVEALLDQLIILQKKQNNMKAINTSYSNSNDLTKTTENNFSSIDYNSNYNLDDDLSEIFKSSYSEKPLKKSKSVISKKMKMLQLKTQDKIKRRILEMSKIKERNYNPNYNSIHPRQPVFSFSTLPKNNKIRRVFKKEICTKFDKHERQFKNRFISKDQTSLSSNITFQDNSYFNVGEITNGNDSRNHSSKHSTVLHIKKPNKCLNMSRLISSKNHSSSSSSTLITACSHKLKITKLKHLNSFKPEVTEVGVFN